MESSPTSTLTDSLLLFQDRAEKRLERGCCPALPGRLFVHALIASGGSGSVRRYDETNIKEERGMSTDSFQVLSTEKRTFPPTKEFSKKAHIKNMKEYEQLYKQSVDKPEKFWEKWRRRT